MIAVGDKLDVTKLSDLGHGRILAATNHGGQIAERGAIELCQRPFSPGAVVVLNRENKIIVGPVDIATGVDLALAVYASGGGEIDPTVSYVLAACLLAIAREPGEAA